MGAQAVAGCKLGAHLVAAALLKLVNFIPFELLVFAAEFPRNYFWADHAFSNDLADNAILQFDLEIGRRHVGNAEIVAHLIRKTLDGNYLVEIDFSIFNGQHSPFHRKIENILSHAESDGTFSFPNSGCKNKCMCQIENLWLRRNRPRIKQIEDEEQIE